MTEDQMRAAIAKAYPGEAWQQKVRKFSPSQVSAVYLRLKNQKKV